MVNKKKRDEQANLEKEKLLNPERMEEKRKKRKRRIAFSIAGGAVLLIVVVVVAFSLTRMVGKNSLHSKAAAAVPDLSPVTATEVLTEEEKEKARKESTEYYNSNAKAGSLASKANMVKQYNEKNNK